MKQEQIRKDDENRNGGGISNPTSTKKSKWVWTYNSNLIWWFLGIIFIVAIVSYFYS